MCNSVHLDTKPIKKTGVGYKLFATKLVGQRYRPIFTDRLYKKKYYKGKKWVIWNEASEEGFCFFLTKKEAQKLLNNLRKDEDGSYENIKIKKIQYEGGLGKHWEDGITEKVFLIGLCTHFRIINSL
jgi:hypothetical protein